MRTKLFIEKENQENSVIVKVGNKWKIKGKKVKYWNADFDTKEDALSALRAYHANKKEKLTAPKRVLESKQVGDLYHVCAIDGMLHIAETNKLESKGIQKNKKTNDCVPVSFTRNKKFIAWTRSLNDFLFRIKVDGDMLSHHYKITPYNDFFDIKGAPVKTQFEEYVDKPITDFKDYILSVEFTYTDKFFKNMDDKKFGYYLIALKKIDYYLSGIECVRVSFPKDTEGYAKVITSRGISVKDPSKLTDKQRAKISKAISVSTELTNIPLKEFTDELINNYVQKLIKKNKT